MQKWLSLSVLISFLSLVGLAGGQVNPGTPSFSAYDSHEVDTINLQNLNVMLNLPVRSKSGAFPFSYSLVGNSYVHANASGSWQSWMMDNNEFYGSTNGVGIQLFAFGAVYTSTSSATCSGGGSTTKYQNWILITADSTIHSLPTTDYTDSAGCLNASFTDQVIDGTGYSISVTLASVNSIYDRAGNLLTSTSLTDTNGNSVSWNGSGLVFTDTLGLTPLTLAFNSMNQTYTWTDSNSGSPQVKVSDTISTVRTVFGCTGITDLLFNWLLPTTIAYPDGTSLGIEYETTPGYSPDVTGRYGIVTLREGGTVTYTYGAMSCLYQIPASLTRVTSDGTTKYVWAHTATGNTTTVTDNGGNVTTYIFSGGILTRVQRYQGASTLLTTDIYCYGVGIGQPTNCPGASVVLPITRQNVYHTISGMSNSSRTETHYDSYGNVTYSAQYDFGATSPTVATTTTYGTWSGSTCVAVSRTINNKPCDVLTAAGSNTIAESRYAYDSKGNLLTTYYWNGSAWLSNATPNTYNANGTLATSYDISNNQTTYSYSAASYVSCGSCTNYPFPTSISKGGLTTYSTWNGIGGVKLTDKDANGKTTTYGYQNSSGTADPFWRVMSITDPISNEVWKTYPAGSSPGTVNSSFAFNSGNSIQNMTGTTDGYGRTTNVQAMQSPSSTNYDTVSKLYGWSTNYKSVTTSQPCSTSSGSNCSAVHTKYIDPLGRLYQGTTNSNETINHTYTQNDDLVVLSPAPTNENNKQVQKEYDGLGRLTKSCAIGNGSSTPCGQNSGSASGVTTSFSYTYAAGRATTQSTRGAQSRTNTYDALGRVIQKVTPEGGTTTYQYDSIPGGVCGGWTSEPGQLMQITDANGISSCYVHNDPLNRMTDATLGGATPTCQRFRYDSISNAVQTQPSGSTISNVAGRLVEAETDNCSVYPPTPASMITDEWFSYDADGRMIDMWEATPNSGQYYHSTATFFGNGTINTLQLASPNLYTMTYGIDGEGRWNTLSLSATNMVTGTTYNAAGQPTQIALTGTPTDQDDYVYDSNTGRMKTFTFQVGNPAKSMVGQLSWNPNGTLSNLAITDGFNPGGTQACYFNPSSGSGMGYDDLGRLLNVSCGASGSVWNQTFSYDQYNNLTKSSSGPGITWNPGYNPSTNHYTLSGTSYDLDGNLTSDPVHSYEWNALSKLESVDRSGTGCATSGECIVYDALGRAVEIDKGSTHTSIWYTQLGKTAFMNGATISYAYFPTPGGGTEAIAGNRSSYYYMHKDWLGNARILSTTGNHMVFADMAFAPYGEIYNQFGSTATQYQMFTGDTQDIVSGTMETPNREYNSAAQGRWLSPDPAGAGWNLYAYATNPNSAIDPSGLCLLVDNLGGCSGGIAGGLHPRPQTPNGGGGGYDTEINWTDDVAGSDGTVGADSDCNPSTCSSSTSANITSSGNDTTNEEQSQPCSGAGIPCGVTLVGGGDNLYSSPNQQYYVWNYQVIDVNGDEVGGTMLITEVFALEDSVGAPAAMPNSIQSVGGSFQDAIGYNTAGQLLTASSFNIQMFSVQFQNQGQLVGPSYDLSTTVFQNTSITGGVLNYGFPLVVVP